MTIKRLLVAGDTHGDTEHWIYLAKLAKERDCNAIFVVGDFGYHEQFIEVISDLDLLESIVAEMGVPFYWCDGNHDNTAMVLDMYGDDVDGEGFLRVRTGVRYSPRGHRWTWNGIRFISLGGAYSVDKHYRLAVERETALKRAAINAKRDPGNQLSEDTSELHWYSREEMTDAEMDAILAADSSPVDVMFAHDKPASSNPGWNRKSFPECLPNQKRLQKAVETLRPELFVHGHLHYRYTEEQRFADGHTLAIIGLDCNTDAQEYRNFDRDPERSWMVLDLEKPFDLPTR